MMESQCSDKRLSSVSDLTYKTQAAKPLHINNQRCSNLQNNPFGTKLAKASGAKNCWGTKWFGE